jgi:hypothetical protein
MMYFAQARGVGTCRWANGPIFIHKNRAARQRLGIAAKERIFGARYLGYSAIPFTNKITGKVRAVPLNSAR